MPEQRTLWQTGIFRLSREEAIIAPAFRDWLLNAPSELGRYLANIRYASEFSEFSGSDVRTLETMIVKANTSKAAALAPLRLLGKIVYRVNHTLQLSIPQPALAIHLTPPKNPFLSGDPILAHRSVEAWGKAEKSWLEELQVATEFQSTQGRNVPFELILLSAILHGGILNSDLAMALHTAITHAEKYIRYTSRIYIDLSLAWQGKPDQEIRRWYPDDGLACLLGRLADREGGDDTGADQSSHPYPELRRRFCDRMHARLRKELRGRGIEEPLLPESLADLFERVALYLRSEIPSVMVGFATRKLDARSLLPPSIDQVYGDPGVRTKEASGNEEEPSTDTENAEGYCGDDLKDDEPIWMELVRESFSAKTAKALQENFERLDSESIAGTRIISFARSLLKHGASSGKKLKPNSVKCCVLTVGRRLGGLLEERDPAAIAPEVLEDLYVRAIDDAANDSENPSHLQATVSWALREFHCYLRREDLVKPLNEADVFAVPRGILTVDAEIVSVDDVFRALDYLQYEPNPSWSEGNREIAKMEILLGFFAGLRTMEGLGACQQHFPGRLWLPFLVLPTDQRGLKTPNAARMIPLAAFIQPFDTLAEYAAKWSRSIAHRESQDQDAKLFENASDDVIIPMINEALRVVTCNDRVRYYSLRHAFGSWTLLRLLLSDLPQIPDLFPHLPKTTEWLRHSMRFRRVLYGNDRVDNNHAWAVSALMGHSTPRVSFGSYCHTLDILLSEFLRNSRGMDHILGTRERLRLSSRYRRTVAYCRVPGDKSTPDRGASELVQEEASDVDPYAEDESNDELVCIKSADIPSYDPDPQRVKERDFGLQHVRDRFPDLHADPVQTKPVYRS